MLYNLILPAEGKHLAVNHLCQPGGLRKRHIAGSVFHLSRKPEGLGTVDDTVIEFFIGLQESLQGIGPDIAFHHHLLRDGVHASAAGRNNRMDLDPCLCRKLILHIGDRIHGQAGPVQGIPSQMRCRSGMGVLAMK